jgi:hypothetical protein
MTISISRIDEEELAGHLLRHNQAVARFMQIYKMLVQLLPPGLPAREDMTEEDESRTDWPKVEAAYAQLMDIQEECQWRCQLVDDLMDRVYERELKLTNLEQARALIDEISRKRIKDK